jgi:hypothetical protein
MDLLLIQDSSVTKSNFRAMTQSYTNTSKTQHPNLLLTPTILNVNVICHRSTCVRGSARTSRITVNLMDTARAHCPTFRQLKSHSDRLLGLQKRHRAAYLQAT